MKSIILNDAQKRYLWDCLDMEEIYYGEGNKYAKFETAKVGEWRLDYNNDAYYPWSLFVVIDYWDDLGQELVDKVLKIKEE